MTKGTSKSSHKYISKKMVNGKWIYDYGLGFGKGKPKLKIEKPNIKIENYYGKGRHRYFKTEKEKKEFQEKQKIGFTRGIGQKIKSSERIKAGTKVKITIGKNKYEGKVIETKTEKGSTPDKFDVEYIDPKTKKLIIKKNIPKELIVRSEKSYYQKKQKNILEKEANELIEKNIKLDPEIQFKAKLLVEANWKDFLKITGKYWRSRINGSFDPRKFGFEYEDLQQEIYLTIYRAALSYIKNPKTENEATFKSYVLGSLKRNLAAIISANVGMGGHLKASKMDQIYLWFYKSIKDEYKKNHNEKEPTDEEMVDILNKKRNDLPDIKGNKVFKQYNWTLEKVKNKKSMTMRMESLDKVINSGDGDSSTMLSILNDEEIEIAGHYKLDPWKYVLRMSIRDEVKDAIYKKITNPIDRIILIRTYGLFVDENSPMKERIYAMGSNSGDIANILNTEIKTKKTWTSQKVDNRLQEILNSLREDKEFKRKMSGLIKSETKEWPEVGLILYWIAIYDIVDKSIEEIIRSPIGDQKNKIPLLTINIGNTEEENDRLDAKLKIDKNYGSEKTINEEKIKNLGIIKNKYVE